MNKYDENRGELIDIARSYLSGDNHVICREDIPELIDELISKVRNLNLACVIVPEGTVCKKCNGTGELPRQKGDLTIRYCDC